MIKYEHTLRVVFRYHDNRPSVPYSEPMDWNSDPKDLAHCRAGHEILKSMRAYHPTVEVEIYHPSLHSYGRTTT